jgi:hypothetical protein
MKKLIHNYLSKFFFIDGNNICRIERNNILSSNALVEELDAVFGMTKKQLKWYVKSWVRKESKSFSFNRYWSPPKFSSFFPFVKRISAQTIGTDLVSVQPLAAPSGQLMYLDYTYNAEPDQGLVFAPYIPLLRTEVLDEAFSPSSGITSRYTRRRVDSRFFQQINLVD